MGKRASKRAGVCCTLTPAGQGLCHKIVVDNINEKRIIDSLEEIMEKYEGDFGCEMNEDSRCRNRAAKVYREPYTPASFAVIVCDEHASHCVGFGYSFDAEATADLLHDIGEEEAYYNEAERNYDAYEAAQLQRLDEEHDGDWA